MNATEFRSKIAAILGVNETVIDNVVVSDTCSSGSFQVTFTINGNNWISADSLFGRLNTMVLTNDTVLKVWTSNISITRYSSICHSSRCSEIQVVYSCYCCAIRYILNSALGVNFVSCA